MPVGRMKALRPLRFFLSEAERATSCAAVALKGVRGPKARIEVGHARELVGCDGAARQPEMKRADDGAPGDGLAVQQTLVACGGLDGVAERVAEVEDHTHVRFALVGSDDIGLDLDGSREGRGRAWAGSLRWD